MEFGYGPPDADGFRPWQRPRVGRFIDGFGAIAARVEPDGRVRVRVEIGRGQSNVAGTIHGGFILAFADQAPFCACFLTGLLPPGGGVSVSVSVDFIGPGALDEPLDALIECVGETGRMIFLRGLMVQGARTVAATSATLRKTPDRPPLDG